GLRKRRKSCPTSPPAAPGPREARTRTRFTGTLAETAQTRVQRRREVPASHRPPRTAGHSLGDPIMPRIIEVHVSPKGETSVQTKGFSGTGCLQASKWLETALGIVTADRKTSEFYQAQQVQQQENQA